MIKKTLTYLSIIRKKYYIMHVVLYIKSDLINCTIVNVSDQKCTAFIVVPQIYH